MNDSQYTIHCLINWLAASTGGAHGPVRVLGTLSPVLQIVGCPCLTRQVRGNNHCSERPSEPAGKFPKQSVQISIDQSGEMACQSGIISVCRHVSLTPSTLSYPRGCTMSFHTSTYMLTYIAFSMEVLAFQSWCPPLVGFFRPPCRPIVRKGTKNIARTAPPRETQNVAWYGRYLTAPAPSAAPPAVL